MNMPAIKNTLLNEYPNNHVFSDDLGRLNNKNRLANPSRVVRKKYIRIMRGGIMVLGRNSS
jgi:hypothetical protein